MRALRIFLVILAAVLGATALRAQVESYGTGEVDASVLRVGDEVEVTYRSADPGTTGRLAEAAGMVVDTGPDAFVVRQAVDTRIFYDAVVRLDRRAVERWTIDRYDLTRTRRELIARYLDDEPDGLAGTWVAGDGITEILLVPSRGDVLARYDYAGILLTGSEGWLPGEIRLLLERTAVGDDWAGIAVTEDRVRRGTTVRIVDGTTIEMVLPDARRRRAVRRIYRKTWPLPEGADSTAVPPVKPDERFGSGFFIDADLVLTAGVVVEGADSVTVTIGGRSAVAGVRARDRRNDIALLDLTTAQRERLGDVSIVPLTLGTPASTAEGDRVVASGFRSPSSVRPVVSEGIVNSLTGPGQDLTRFTISIPVRAGEVGGPLLDRANRVIGIVLAPDTTEAEPVSVAVKADLVRALLRHASAGRVARSDTTARPLDVDTSLIAQMARAAVVAVRTK